MKLYFEKCVVKVIKQLVLPKDTRETVFVSIFRSVSSLLI